MNVRTAKLHGWIVGPLAVAAAIVACSGGDKRSGFGSEPADAAGEAAPASLGNGDARLCKGWECNQAECPAGEETTLTGTVYAPNGTLPLYNAIVYVPNADPDPLSVGATCDPCGAVTGEPVVSALSGSDGTFTLKDMPAGTDVPIVIQIGKWRRRVTIPEVKACKENEVKDRDLTRLPKNQSEGDMPHIALTTGLCDNVGCMLPKVGIDASEFGTKSDGPAKAVHVYVGGGDSGPVAAPEASDLWSDSATMKAYDMLILSCECSESLETKGGSTNAPTFTAMTDYLNAGGRIFTTDFMYTWYRYSPDPKLSSAANIVGGAPSGGDPISINTSFPKGQALADWLMAVGVSGGTVSPDSIYANIVSVDPSLAQDWGESPDPQGPRVFTVNTPAGLPAEQQCGKGVHIDAHVNGTDSVDESFPAGCSSSLMPAEDLLAFFFFDLASCIQDDRVAPTPPK